jgi:DNA invertase Pin-like site-specific DNA recombinase
MKVAIYTRLSPNPKKDDTVSQERDLREFANKQGWEVVGHYTDLLVSGSTKGGDRPQFKKMMQDASKRKFDLVLFWSLDRLSREGAFKTLEYLNQLNNWGVEYKSYTEQYLDSCGVFKDAVISIMAVIAKQERIRLIERTVAGLQTARLKGKILGRPKAVVNIDEAMAMRKNGISLKKIGEELGTSEATISRILKGLFDRATY